MKRSNKAKKRPDTLSLPLTKQPVEEHVSELTHLARRFTEHQRDCNVCLYRPKSKLCPTGDKLLAEYRRMQAA